MAYTLDSIDWTKPVKIQGTFIGKTHDPVLFDLAQRLDNAFLFDYL